MWIQHRSIKEKEQKAPLCQDSSIKTEKLIINEFGVNYNITLGQNYDPGLYTDMAHVRDQLSQTFSQSKKVLNLYAYTGAFSLFALKKGAQSVVSLDLSAQYMSELEENIKINPKLDINKHESMIMSSSKALKVLIKQQSKFDLIISDPPSSSNDGLKRSNALKKYELELTLIEQLLTPQGIAILFLNTHKVSISKFKRKIDEIISSNNLKLKFLKELEQTSDCPKIKGFPEGAYLKGLIFSHD